MTPGDTPPTVREDFREQVIRFADALSVAREEVLFQSASRDPLNKGTAADHAKGEWFGDLWERAVANRAADTIHIRGLHYVVVQLEEAVEPPTNCEWDRYRNTDACYDYLTDAGVCARVLGYVPLGGVADEKNTQHVVTEYADHETDISVSTGGAQDPVEAPEVPTVTDGATVAFDDIEEYIHTTAERAARRTVQRVSLKTDRQQPFHVELWSEKALPEAVKRTAERAGVNAVVEGEGHLSYRVAHDFVERVKQAEKPAVVFYLTDFDPAGETMPGAMASKVSWLDLADVLNYRVTLSRLAVTADQVDRYDLPREPVEADGDAYETLAEDFQDRHGGGAVELSALEADLETYCEIVREGVRGVRDDSIQERNSSVKSDLQREVRHRVAEQLHEQNLEELEADLRERVEEFNDELATVVDTLDRLGELRGDIRQGREKWNARVREAIHNVTEPSVEVPEGEAEPPAGVMYDSARAYLENVRAIHPDGDLDAAGQEQLSQFGVRTDGGFQ